MKNLQKKEEQNFQDGMQVVKKIKVKQDNKYARKKWEVEQEIIISKKKENEEQKLSRFLEQRKEKLDLEFQVGKQKLINKEVTKQEQPGFYCKDCDCVMNDSSAYLDHINGKQRMNMKVPKVGLDKVIQRFQQKKTQNQIGVQNYEQIQQKYLQDQDEIQIQEINEEEIDENLIEMQQMGLPLNFGQKKVKK